MQNNLKKAWQSLKPGDVIISKNIGPTHKAIVLEKNNKKITLSPFCQRPLLIEMPGGPFSWSEEKQSVVGASGQPIPLFDSIEIQKGSMLKVSQKYRAIKKPRKIDTKQFEVLSNFNATTMMKIDEIIRSGERKHSEVMSLILNRVFGSKGYSNDQLVALTQIMATFQEILNKHKILIAEQDKIINDLQEQIVREVHQGFDDAKLLLSPIVGGIA